MKSKRKISIVILIVLIFVFLNLVYLIGAGINRDKINTAYQTTQVNKPQETAQPKITISNTTYKAGAYDTHEVLGEVKNNDAIKHSVILKATFYDTSGKIMGTASGAVNDIEAGQTKTFNLLTMDKVAGYKDFKVQVDTVI